MIKRSELRKALKNNDTTKIAKDLAIAPKSRFFFSEEEANEFARDLYRMNPDYTCTSRTWDCTLDDASDEERAELAATKKAQLDALEYPRPQHVVDELVEYASNKTTVYSVTSDAPEAVLAEANGESGVMVIREDQGFDGVPEKFYFVPMDEAKAHYGVYGFYFLNHDGELEPYTEEDYMPEGTTVFTKATHSTPDADALSGKIEEFAETVDYFRWNEKEIELHSGIFEDVTPNWIEEYGVSHLLDLRKLGQEYHDEQQTGWVEYYAPRTSDETYPPVLFPRDQSVWVGTDNDSFYEPITDDDEIKRIVDRLED